MDLMDQIVLVTCGVWSPGFAWDRHSRQYCMMVRNKRHWTLNSHSEEVRATRRYRVWPALWTGKVTYCDSPKWSKIERNEAAGGDAGSSTWKLIHRDDKFRGRRNKAFNERSEFLHENRCARGWGYVNWYEFESRRWRNWNLYAQRIKWCESGQSDPGCFEKWTVNKCNRTSFSS